MKAMGCLRSQWFPDGSASSCWEKASVTSTAAPLSNNILHSILSEGSCALPTNSLMFNSFPDTWGTLITTTTRGKKTKGEAKRGWGEEWEETKCLPFCLPWVDVKLMKGLQQGQTWDGNIGDGGCETNKRCFPSVLFDWRSGWGERRRRWTPRRARS